MKENILDVLMYLFEHYTDEDIQLIHDQDSLKTELSEAGFPYLEINKAFAWLEGLVAQQENPAVHPVQAHRPVRSYTQEEAEKLDVECRGFLLFLEQTGVLDGPTRELVLDRVMALETEEISLEQLKWVVLMVLFNQPGQEAAFAWMENLVYDELPGNLH